MFLGCTTIWLKRFIEIRKQLIFVHKLPTRLFLEIMDTNQVGIQVAEQLAKWQKSQENQTDGYEFEKNFDEFMKNLSKELFQNVIGEVPNDRHEKKSSD